MSEFALDHVLSRLTKVNKVNGGYMARCPAHEDRTPSLSVTERDGRVLVNCFAGCPTDATPKQWQAWRRANPPAHLQPENRKGSHCGICGGALGPVTRICADCWRADR